MLSSHFQALIALLSLGGAANVQQQKPVLGVGVSSNSYITSDFDSFVKDTLEEYHVPGLSLAIVDGDNISTKGYGIAKFPDQEVTADTLFFTGSTTKAFTAATVAQLVHDESYPDLTWKTPIVNFLREDFVLEDEHATLHTTIEDALSHRTGMPRHDLSYGRGENETVSSIVKRMRYLPLTYAPRTQYQYCNLMFAVMTDLVETVTGVEQGKLTIDKIWKPLGMHSTTYDLDSVLADSEAFIAQGYYWTPNRTYIAEPYLNLLPIAGAGATISSINDYSLWAKALLDAANPNKPMNKSSPITRHIWHDVTRPRTIMIEADETTINSPLYALGWVTQEILGRTVVWHNGGLDGFGTELYLVPELGFGIATMGNTAGSSNVAGKVILSRLLANKLGAAEDAETSVRDMLVRGFDIVPSWKQRMSAYHEEYHDTKLPLPGPIEKFAGQYRHPGYGSIEFKALSSNSLQGLFATHIWPTRLDLNHLTDSVFAVNISHPHGIGDLEDTSEASGVIWSLDDSGQAAFKFSLDGETVEKLGMQLEPKMVEATEGNAKRWQEGMIWFEKL